MLVKKGRSWRGVVGTLIWVFLAVLWVAGPAFSQQPTGTILGVVRDPSGAVIPGASVTVTRTDTGLVRTTRAGADGSYRLPALPVGPYQIRVEQAGFQSEVRSGLVLNVGQEAVLNFSLQVGAVEQTVAVTAEAPMIETTSATVSGLVNEQEVRDLPLNARSLIELGALFPGVTVSKTAPENTTAGFATKLSITGMRWTQNLFQMDGAEVNDSGGSAGSSGGGLIGVETVQEFNIVTSGFSAEYGKHTGGVFNAVTKSGTNEFHGSVFEFLRNIKMDAARWEDNALNNGEKPPYKRNQFGFILGGPVRRDRTFFFGSYEALRERLSLTQSFQVPSEALRARGEFPDGTVVPINPVVRPFLESWPRPKGRDLGDGRAEFNQSSSAPTDENFFTGKVDHRFSDQDTIFGRYRYDGAERIDPTSSQASIAWVPSLPSRSQNAAVSETHLFSPQAINVLLLAFNRARNITVDTNVGGLGFPTKSFTDFQESVGLLETGTPPLSPMGGGNRSPSQTMLENFQLKDDLFYTRAAHALKFGFNGQFLRYRYKAYRHGGGNFVFQNLRDFLQGLPRDFTALVAGSDVVVYPRQGLFGFYAQDDWRVSPRLTLNLGLRYEFVTTAHVAHGRVSNLHQYLTPGQTPEDLVLGNPTYLNPSLKNWAPRVGFAWDPTGSGKTVIRGGVGIFYDQLLPGQFLASFISTPPFFQRGQIRYNAITQPIRPDFPNAAFTQQALLRGIPDIEPLQYKPSQPIVYKASLDIQRAITPSTSVEVGFSGTRGVHLMRVLGANATLAQQVDGRLFIPRNAPLLSPDLGSVLAKQSDGVSTYYGWRFLVNQRLSRGLQLRGAYTFSKAIDEGSNFTGNTDFDNGDARGRYAAVKDRGKAAFDIRNALTMNFTYDLPGRSLTGVGGQILGGWQASGILTAQSGNPFSPNTGFNPRWWSSTGIGGYPDLVTGAKVRYDTRNPERYFDPSAFKVPGAPDSAPTTPNPGFVGNVERGFLTGPGIWTTNFVLAKRINFGEKLRLQFRSEFYNLFNRPNFADPNPNLFTGDDRRVSNDTQAGRITATTGSAREIQLGLKLEF